MKDTFEMQSRAYRGMISIVLLCALVFSFVQVDDAVAFDRKVLFEDFTSTTCGPCAGAASALEAGLQIAEEVVVPIAIHVWWPGAGNDPWYLDNPDENRIRVNYYGINAVPHYKIDGITFGGQWTAEAFSAAIIQASFVESPLLIELRAIIINDVLTVSAEITAEETLERQYLYVALVEDYYRYNAPTGQRDHYDAMIKFVTPDAGFQFSIEEDEALDYVFEVPMEGLGWHDLEIDNLFVVAWVQNRNRTVQQAQNFLSLSEISLDMDFAEAEEGDEDGRIEPGESGNIVFTLGNAETSPNIRNMSVTLTADDDEIEIISGTFVIENLDSGEEADNSEAPLIFSVPEDFEARPVTFTVEFVSNASQIMFIREYTMMIGWPPLLVVDATSSIVAGQKMMEFFGDPGLPWADRISRSQDGILTAELAENYDVILWHTFNDEEDIIIDFEEDVLTDFLDNGGTVIFSSFGFATGWAESDLLNNYFATGLEADDIGDRFLHGAENAPYFANLNLFAGGGEGAGMPNHSPSLEVLEGGREIVTWGNGRVGENNGVAGIVHETETYRTMMLAFPIESLAGYISTDDRDEFLRRIWNWYMRGDASVPADEGVQPVGFALDPAFPNPFNSRSMIPFSLETGAKVSVSVHDLSGREVFKLFNGILPRGRHTVFLDAHEAGLVTGVYCIHLKAGNLSASRKVLYLR